MELKDTSCSKRNSKVYNICTNCMKLFLGHYYTYDESSFYKLFVCNSDSDSD